MLSIVVQHVHHLPHILQIGLGQATTSTHATCRKAQGREQLALQDMLLTLENRLGVTEGSLVPGGALPLCTLLASLDEAGPRLRHAAALTQAGRRSAEDHQHNAACCFQNLKCRRCCRASRCRQHNAHLACKLQNVIKDSGSPRSMSCKLGRPEAEEGGAMLLLML